MHLMDLEKRISFYTRKVAERGRIRPHHDFPRAYTYRDVRLAQYKAELNRRCLLAREGR